MAITIIPAEPGWYALAFSWSLDSKELSEVCRQPIIAWRVESEVSEYTGEWVSYVTPIGVESLLSDELNTEPGTILLRPDGKVCFVEDDEFPGEVAAKEEYMRRVEKQRGVVKAADTSP
jgi:hypothetical protein